MTPLEFLKELWQYKPEETYILIWTLPDKRSRWFQSVEAAAEAAEYVGKIQGGDVYVGIGLAAKEYGPTHRCVSGEITGLAGLASDFDMASAAHSKKALPATIPEALSIIPPQFPPSIVIATGNGVHCWWLFKEPYIFESDEDRADVQRVIRKFHEMLRLNAARHRWSYDRLSDLARVLRVPGTLNHKDPKNPKPIIVVSREERRYNLSDIEEFLDEAGIPDPEAQQQAAGEWAARFVAKPLVVDLNARIPQEVIDRWMDPKLVDPRDAMRFRNTWTRQRHDLKDQSSSGYDLALACFGVDAGLSDQQIVDLIVHHRSLHGNKQRTRVDYFERTVAKAYRRSGQPLGQAAPGAAAPAPLLAAAAPAKADTPAKTDPAPPAATAPTPPAGIAPEGQKAATGEGAKTVGPLDEELAKLRLCGEISVALGVEILRLEKYTGKDPTYLMFLGDGTKIEFPSVGKLITQDSVRVAIAAAVGRIIPKIRPRDWDALAQKMLDSCVIMAGPEEMSLDGATRMYVTQYLQETGRIATVEGQTVQNARKPMVIDGRIAICTSDIQTYINRTTFQNLSVKAIAGMLGSIGAKGFRFRGAKFKDQSRWYLPAEFDPEEYYPDIRDAKPQEVGDAAD